MRSLRTDTFFLILLAILVLLSIADPSRITS